MMFIIKVNCIHILFNCIYYYVYFILIIKFNLSVLNFLHLSSSFLFKKHKIKRKISMLFLYIVYCKNNYK